MSRGRVTIGRGRELATLTERLEAARGGRGNMVLVTGEAGIGKSHLVTRLAELASEREMKVAWGRCWEAGGAPAYWPWIEVLRELLAARAPEQALETLGNAAPILSELVPTIADPAHLEPPPPLEAREARFRLFDAVMTVLARIAAERPLLVLLEDLHAADSASLSLLDFIARSTAAHPIGIVGTYRSSDARLAGVLDLLARPARVGDTLVLGPLDVHGVAQLIELVTGAVPTDALVGSIADASEGNPLYVAELARLVHARGGELDATGALPAQIASVIGERVARVPETTASLLRIVSVLGREIGLADASALAGAGAVEVKERLDPAIRGGLIEPFGPSTYRFTHVLVREVLHRELGAAERSSLHLHIARALEERHRGDPAAPLSRIAHHYLEAGAEAGDRGIQFAIRAAERALTVLAYGEAAELYAMALSSLEAIAPEASARRCALLLSLGHAQLIAGDVQRGKASCREAARLARLLGSVELLARSALEYGSTFSFGQVDSELIALLGEALDALDEQRPELRALVLARLAAALQPAPDPQGPLLMAREAIELAREHGDDETLLAVIRSACSAMMDFADPRERIAINREHVALARRLEEPAEVLRGRVRLVFDHLELGETEEADRVIDAYGNTARALGHPAFLWVAETLRAMRAIMTGRFAEAGERRARAAALAERSGDNNAALVLRFQGLALARASWDEHELGWALEDGLEGFPAMTRTLVRAVPFLHRGDRTALEVECRGLDPDAVAAAGDPHLLTFVAEIAAALEDLELARRVYEALVPHADRNVSWGMVCFYNEGPIEHWLGILAWMLGRREEASERFDRALERARAMRFTPAVARTCYEHGRRLVERHEQAPRTRARVLLAEALDIAQSLEMPGLEQRIDALHDGSEAKPPAEAERKAGATTAASGTSRRTLSAPRFRREGDVWAIEFGGSAVRVKSTKGIEILARLVAEPGRELHALDLVTTGGSVTEAAAGQAIDARAREAYRLRAQRLRTELDEATEWNDLGRAERARAELEALEAELRRSLGIGGRARSATGSSERARTNVQKRIRDAQRRISAHHPELAEHLSRTIKTGTFCSYQPLPR